MGKQKKARKYATMKRMLSLRDQGLKEKDRLKPKKKEKKDPSALKEREVPQHPSCLFFQYNTQLGPPYHILVDTNFINSSIKAKLDLVQSMMDCLYAKCIPCITDCVMAEIEKLGQKYRVALRIAKDPRFERLPCTHKGTYADDCLVQRVPQHKCYIVATVDRDLKRRIRKIPGVPIMYISNHRKKMGLGGSLPIWCYAEDELHDDSMNQPFLPFLRQESSVNARTIGGKLWGTRYFQSLEVSPHRLVLPNDQT
ncbi:PREDICTED: rRNA-processing protein FCF1 homolog [Odobenus rosmarus divergens]|uniref:rRNA-processing protein FCF1 homolog n=1 Tax=Odobenus rosmarus divergens TaxID=9708 RepID=A0A9B0GLX6_ODORO